MIPKRRAKDRFDQWLRDYPRATPVAVFCVALGLVVTAAWSVELAEKRIRLATQQSAAVDMASSLERLAAVDSAYLAAMGAVLSNISEPTPKVFGDYVKRLHIIESLQGVVGIGWVQPVERGDLAPFKARMIASGVPDFTLRPNAQPAAWPAYVVTTLEPADQQASLMIGYDMRSESRRARAMEKARQTGAISATDTTRLVLDTGKTATPGFLVFTPVRSLEEGQRFRGFLYSPVRTHTFVDAAVSQRLLSSGHVEIYDRTPSGEELIYNSNPSARTLGAPIEEHVDLFDQQWTLRYWPVAHEGFYPLSFVVLFGGTAFSMLLLAYVLLIQRRNGDLHALLDAQMAQEQERGAFIRELNHRVKNSLANVTSIISLTRHSTDDVQLFADTLLQRVRALAAGHSLLDSGHWAPTDLHAIVAAQLGPYDRSNSSTIIEGPPVVISPNDALTIGLALHELATNATHYGALSVEGGKVSVRWKIAEENWVEVDWTEEGGPTVVRPESQGFGLNLIQRALAHELRRPIEISFDPEGLRCRFFVQLRQPRSFQLRN